MRILLLLAASFCPIEVTPVKPIVPVQCSDLVRSCLCDSNNEHCHWAWSCIPR